MFAEWRREGYLRNSNSTCKGLEVWKYTTGYSRNNKMFSGEKSFAQSVVTNHYAMSAVLLGARIQG